MKMKIYIILFLALVLNSNAQPVISYIIPDLGTPGMATYMEIIGPFNPDSPALSTYNFGPDSYKFNNSGDNYRVRCLNPNDTNKITIGPCVISWNGRMISTQIFVNPAVISNSWDWEVLNDTLKIPIVVEISPGVISNADTFYIVQPQPMGDIRSNTERVIGTGSLGKRSRRGAMIVDSLMLANDTYRISRSDCDPNTDGNQGFLPIVILSKGKVIGSPSTVIDASGDIPRNGHGGYGGPGGGGGGGRFCDFRSGDDGGSGFISGGRGGKNNVIGGGGSLENFGSGSGSNGYSLNQVYPPKNSSSNWEASGGGTGHPFGKSGTGTGDGNSDNPEGGYGGGSGFQQKRNGGSGGYASAGANSNNRPPTNSISGGKIYGNDMGVPLAGGSGGASGNPNSISECSGGGGGGGGAILLYAPYINNIAIYSNGANGQDGTDGSATRGGSGSGGFANLSTKLPLNTLTLQVQGGKDQNGTVNGGAGRMRYDVPQWMGDNTNIPNDASHYRGPTSDTLSFVKRNMTITGSRGDNQNIWFYLKPQSGNWMGIINPQYNGNNWSLDLDLSGKTYGYDWCNDSIFYFLAMQEVKNQNGNIVTHDKEPMMVFSQAATNIFKVIPDIQGDTVANMHIVKCDGTESDSVSFVIENAGGPSLYLDLANAYFDAPANGLNFNGFELIKPQPALMTNLASCESTTLTVRYTYQAGQKGQAGTVLFIPHNDNSIPNQNPWQTKFIVTIDSFGIQSYDNNIELNTVNKLVLDSVCLNTAVSKRFIIKNNSDLDINLNNFIFSDKSGGFSGSSVNENLIASGSSIEGEIVFNGTNAIGQYTTRVYIKPIECDNAIDSFDVQVDVVSADIVYIQNSIEIGTLDFGSVKVGKSKALNVKVINKGNSPALIQNIGALLPVGQTEFSIVNLSQNLPFILDKNSGSELIITIEYKPTAETDNSATLSFKSEKNNLPLSCDDDGDLILLGKGIRSKVTIFPIDFGLKAICENSVYDSILVNNSGASVQVLSNGEIIGKDKDNFKIINPKISPYSLSNGDSVYYLIEFNPSIGATGPKSATFHLLTDDISDADIYTSISGMTDSLNVEAIPKFVSFGGVPVPQDKSANIQIINNGQFNVTIEKIIVDDPLVSVSPNITNQVLPAKGASLNIKATVSFNEYRKVNAKVKVIISNPCNDTLITTLSGEGLKGKFTYLTDMTFGNIAFCNDTTLEFNLINLGDPPIEIQSMRLLAQNDYKLFSLQGAEPKGVIINKNETYRRDIIFKPANTTEGSKVASLETKIVVNAEEQDLITTLYGNRESGLLSQPNEIDFGNIIVGANDKKSLKITNVGKKDITISSLLALQNYPNIFIITPSQLNSPVVLVPGDSIMFDIQFIPNSAIEYVDTLRLAISSPCQETKQIILKGNGKPALSARVWLPKLKLKPYLRNYHIPIYMTFDEAGNDMQNIAFNTEIKFNSTVFYPSSVSSNAQIISNYVDVDNNRILTIKATNVNINDNDSTTVDIIGSTLLGSTDYTDIIFDSFNWDMANVISPVQAENGRIDLLICREGQNRLLNYGNPLQFSIQPNPASDEIIIKGNALEKGVHQIEMVNLQGENKIIEKWNVKNDGNKNFEFKINTDDFISGFYFIILRSPAKVKTHSLFIIK